MIYSILKSQMVEQKLLYFLQQKTSYWPSETHIKSPFYTGQHFYQFLVSTNFPKIEFIPEDMFLRKLIIPCIIDDKNIFVIVIF